MFNLNTTFVYFPQIRNMRFFEFENVDLLDKGILLETFFRIKHKKAKSITQLEEKEIVKVETPVENFIFPFFRDQDKLKAMKKSNPAVNI